MGIKTAKKNVIFTFIERIGNKLPHPIYMFIILSFIVVVVSKVLDGKEITENIVVKNLVSKEGLIWFSKTMIDNFIKFPPLGMVIVTMLGIGLGEETGFISAVLKITIIKAPVRLVTAIVLFTGIMGNIAGSAVFIIIPPLAALIFKSLGRHPIAGLAAGYMGVAGGLSANLLITPTDVINSGITQLSAQTLIHNYQVAPTSNWYFMIVSTFLLTLVGTLVIEKIIEPKLEKELCNDEEKIEEVTEQEKKAMKFSMLSLGIYFILLGITIIPTNGILRGENGSVINSPFMESMILVLTLMFFIPSLAYGIITKKIRTKEELLSLMTKSISQLSSFILLCFFAAQFVNIFKYTNLGVLISNKGALLIQNLEIPKIFIILVFILFCTFVNFFIGSLSAKWTILAPIFVPLFIKLGLTPEFTQAAFRIADSVTNPISPLEPFLPFMVICMQKYNKNYGLGSLITVMLPLTISFLIFWTLLLFVWYWLNLPLGPGSYIFM